MTDHRAEKAMPQRRKEELLDEALKDSFPASDPPAITQPSPAAERPARPARQKRPRR